MRTINEGNEIDIESQLSTTERMLSVAGGSYLIYNSIIHEGKSLLKAISGSYLMYRGVSGYCPISESFGRNEVDRLGDIHLETEMVVERPRDEVYRFWRDLENLPLFMEHLESVTKIDNKRSEWKAKIPGHLGTISWKSEIIEDTTGDTIGWQSVEGSTIENTGSIRFKDAGNSKTKVSVVISYQAPLGKAGQDLAKVLNPVFKRMVKKDVEDFKHYVEEGKVAK